MEAGDPAGRLYDERRRLTDPIIDYVRNSDIDTVFVLIPEVEPEHFWQRVLQNQRGALLAHALRKNTDAVVCRLRLRIPDKDPETDVAPKLVSVSHSADTTAAAGILRRVTRTCMPMHSKML